jgi:hypothetical protein
MTYTYDGHDGYACPFCNGTAVDVDFEAQPDRACLCPCHEQDNAQFFLDHAARSAEARCRDEQRAEALGSYKPVRQVLDLTAERTALWLEMVRLAQDVADERRYVTCRCVWTHEPGCPVVLAQKILARLQELS